jgi:hypothetical protein
MFKASVIPQFDLARVMTRVEKSDSCWNWKGNITHYGYGTYGNRNFMAHRVVYQLLTGNLRQEDTLDHLCKNKGCVNPRHLEPVSLRVNVLRSDNPNAVNARKTECHKGHPFTDDNTYIHPKRGHRQCRTCRKDAGKRFAAVNKKEG